MLPEVLSVLTQVTMSDQSVIDRNSKIKTQAVVKGILQMKIVRFDLSWPFESFNHICIVSLYINYVAYSFHIFCIKSKKSLCIETCWFPDFYLARGLRKFLEEKKGEHRK